MFYDRYDQLCRQRGVSKSAAAEQAGFAKSLVSKWKKYNIEIPSPDILHKLSAYFGMPVSELLGEEEQKENPGIPKDTEVDPIKAELLNLIEDATAAERKDYLDILRAFVSRHEKR